MAFGKLQNAGWSRLGCKRNGTEKVKNVRHISGKLSVPHNRPLGTVGRWRGNAPLLHKNAAVNPSGNIKLSEVTKLFQIAQELFVQRDEFAIFEEKVAKKS